MPRSANQKLKLLFLLRILEEKTDEQHPMTVPEMLRELAAWDILAERKSVYDDLDALERFGVDLVKTSAGFYVGSRDFQLPELKLLVDSVQSARFISRGKTDALIRKLEGQTSKYEAVLLQRQVYVQNRVKSGNESVYYSVDALSDAINFNRQVKFRYFEYTVDKQRRFRRDGAFYQVSPFALMWDDENYYLLAYDAAAAIFKHYRVDKMTDLSVGDLPREGTEAFYAVDMSAYTKRVFSMFGGAEKRVRLRFSARLAGAVLDRFGEDTAFFPGEDAQTFEISVPVEVSPQFFGWLTGFAGQAELLSPPEVVEEYREILQKLTAQYAAGQTSKAGEDRGSSPSA